MNKILSLVLATLLVQPSMGLLARGGDVAAGLFGGLAVGTLVGTAAASSNNRQNDRIDDKLEKMKMQREQDEKVEQIRRELQTQREMERRMSEQEQARIHDKMFTSKSEGSLMYLLFGLVFLLLLGVIGLAVMVFRNKNNRPF